MSDMIGLRIDKWLWAARFYKSRSLASEDVSKSRVLINDLAVKPSRDVKNNDEISIHSGQFNRVLIVTGLSDKRGPASQAALLYQETPDSIAQNKLIAEQRKLAPEPGLTHSQGRPTKRNRRQTDRIKDGEKPS